MLFLWHHIDVPLLHLLVKTAYFEKEFWLEPRQFKNNLTMFESKLILKLPPFSLTYTVREKGGNFKMSLLSNIVRLFLNCLGSNAWIASKQARHVEVLALIWTALSSPMRMRKEKETGRGWTWGHRRVGGGGVFPSFLSSSSGGLGSLWGWLLRDFPFEIWPQSCS